MELEDLVGTHMLDGVDYGIVDDMANSGYDFTNVISFRLDGIVYTATEDPDDGYRSCMRELTVNESSAIKNSFEPIQVIAKMSDCGNILLVTDPLPKKYIPAFNALLNETSIAEEETAALFYQLVVFDRNADALAVHQGRHWPAVTNKVIRALAELGLLVPYNEWNTACVTRLSVFKWLVSAIDFDNPKRLFNWPQCDSTALAACCEEHPRIKQYMQAHTRDVDSWPITDSPLADLAKAIFLKDGDLVVTV